MILLYKIFIILLYDTNPQKNGIGEAESTLLGLAGFSWWATEPSNEEDGLQPAPSLQLLLLHDASSTGLLGYNGLGINTYIKINSYPSWIDEYRKYSLTINKYLNINDLKKSGSLGNVPRLFTLQQRSITRMCQHTVRITVQNRLFDIFDWFNTI